ncbi:bifunctional protein-serine/threonine kinase/phosphatase [Salinisphaera orenii]|uniref:bifunctional protein-serine/threonine kinase/phosphatase n=1 Tax=Salinisphaera orenii TaxID=856731 RepID=UPI000F469619|nr:bifunctional protein-serine/threonine kinase/phosphatase [Salinisphaera halophila]
MSEQLRIAAGQYSSAGRKAMNQDFHGLCTPEGPALASKGIAIAIADGIGSSEVSHVASETAVAGFLDDYYCTSEAWSVRRSAERVITATNAWLHTQTRQSPYREDADRGYVCTFSALVLKATTAHVFHVGDARIYRLRDGRLGQLTEDHRVAIGGGQSYLARALGVGERIDIDYRGHSIATGDVFVLLTDGVHEHVDDARIAEILAAHAEDPDAAAKQLAARAFEAGSEDNLTAQVVRVEAVPHSDPEDIAERLTRLPHPPELEARDTFEGYEIVRQLHVSSRSRIHLAREMETDRPVALKTPGSDLRDDPVLLERFLLEEWIARRLDSPHVLKPAGRRHRQAHVYVAMEYIEGTTLTQWMIDHPRLEMAAVRELVTQIGKGVLAFHRQEMIHQDLRPDNILIDATGTVKIIDFGAVEVAGISESAGRLGADEILGTEQYAAPEYFLGERGTVRSDLFSLAAITYNT